MILYFANIHLMILIIDARNKTDLEKDDAEVIVRSQIVVVIDTTHE
jgi:hypothetical protein